MGNIARNLAPAQRTDSRADDAAYWVERARYEFTKRFTREHYGIDIDDCHQVYGDNNA